ncbi:hypothetical protein LCL97_12825 [Seohaeicola saemankumensis]|nr:hypothetical protein [Seohaeicola saemankumensis]MCA0871714.1 hypothetical protein [Seohaeicola saemankumensis]
MGPLRRGLTALAALAAPGTAWAGVCDTMRPGWTPGTAPTAIDEAIALGSTLPSLVLLAATLVCAFFRLQWASLVVVLLWTALISLPMYLPISEVHATAIAEGCIGSPTLFMGIVIAICVALVLHTAPRNDRS